jgi:sugar/nucleoside kinase (ribokinase family)
VRREPSDAVDEVSGDPTPRTGPTVAVVGYLSLDEIVIRGQRHGDVPGGAALYAALGAAAAGARVFLGAARGPDLPDAVLDRLREAGVDVSAVVPRAHPTRRARLVYGDDGRRESSHYREPDWHAATRALAPPLLPDRVYPAAVVATAMPLDDLERQVAWARARGVKVVVDTSEAFAAADPARLLALLPAIDLFAPSREETRCICPGLDDDSALTALAARCPRVVQKRGAEGLVLAAAARSSPLHLPALTATVVDPTGAGDACVGALAVGLVRGLEDLTLLQLGLAIAARTVAAVGPAGLGPATPAAARKGTR